MLRVVSLLPSSTEMLALCLREQSVGEKGAVVFVGRDHESDFPKEFVSAVPMLTSAKVHALDFSTSAGVDSANDVDKTVSALLSSGSSLYELNEDLVKQLQPDVVLTQSLCEVCSIDLKTVERTVRKMGREVQVVDLNPKTIEQVISDGAGDGGAKTCAHDVEHGGEHHRQPG